MVVVDKKVYISKAQKVLEQASTYRPLAGEPTSKCKVKSDTLLRKIKKENGMDYNT